MTLFFQSNDISREWERIEIALGKIKVRKGKSGPIMDRHANPEILTFSKGVERDLWRTRHINHGQQAPVQNLGKNG